MECKENIKNQITGRKRNEKKEVIYRGLAVAFSAILLATSNPATLQNVAAKGIHLQKKAKAKMILEDPTENGAYTLSMTINKEGTSEESMLSGFIDPKIKVTVQDGKTWVSDPQYNICRYDVRYHTWRFRRKL